jgi:hypothetical protein
MEPADASALQLWGAFCFGVVIGWYVYYVNRYRKGDVALGDIVTVVGAIGGGAVLALFPAESDLFGAYGLGLAAGFFGYFAVLLVLVGRSEHFTWEWFLDGRRRKLPGDFEIPAGTTPTARPMGGEKKLP